MKNKWFKVGLLVMAMLLMSTNVVFAADSNLEVVHGNGSIKSYTISKDKVGNKEKLHAAAQAELESMKLNTIRPFSIYSYLDSVSGSGSTAYSNGNVRSSFNCDVYVDGFPGYTVQISGNSSDFWSGTTPYNADSINSSDTFSFTTFGIAGLSITYPPGMDFAVGDKTAVLSYPEHTNGYSYYHTFSGIQASTGVLGSITKYSHSHANTMKFGNRTVSSACNDSTIVW